MSVVHLSGSFLLWSCKDSSQEAEGSWFPIGEDECHDMKTDDPGSTQHTSLFQNESHGRISLSGLNKHSDFSAQVRYQPTTIRNKVSNKVHIAIFSWLWVSIWVVYKNYFLTQCQWIVDINLATLWLSKYPPLFTDTEVNLAKSFKVQLP